MKKGDKEIIEELANFMHNEYEKYSKEVGWKTQKDCQTLFDELPPANKEVMLWVAKSVLDKVREQERAEILQIVIEDVPHKYQGRLLEELE